VSKTRPRIPTLRVTPPRSLDRHVRCRDGNLTLVGAPAKPLGVSAFGLIMGRRSLSGSNIGGIAETQEMLDFCGAHNITADVEVIPIQKVNEAYERLLKSDVKYRFSIDMASLKSE
jgi:alcohol dehydrogenase (NADP+)